MGTIVSVIGRAIATKHFRTRGFERSTEPKPEVETRPIDLIAAMTTIFIVGYKRHRRSEILDAAVEAVFDEGLNKLSFGRLASRLAIADRTIVYYFPTKEQLISEVSGQLAGELMSVLDTAFGPDPLPADDLLRRAWPALTTERADRVFRVFFEFVGLAAARAEPYFSLAPTILSAWAAWLQPKVATTARASVATAETYALMAKLDGLLLLRHISGPDVAKKAARSLGVV